MTVHAFVDESRRREVYVLAAAVARPDKLTLLRRELRQLLAPGQREVHFRKEAPRRRRALATAIGRLPVDVRIYTRSFGRAEEEAARRDCLERLIQDLVAVGAHRLVLDTRASRDRHDQRTIQRALGPRPSGTHLVYEHVDSTSEPLVWIADAAAWSHADGGECGRRIAPIVGAIVRL